MPAARLKLLLLSFVVMGGFWLGAMSAHCAGNAHVVDDSEVVEPGTCQLETWVTSSPPVGGFLNVAPSSDVHTSNRDVTYDRSGVCAL